MIKVSVVSISEKVNRVANVIISCTAWVSVLGK